MSPRTSYPAAAAVLAERDPVMASLVAAAGPMRLRKPLDTHFAGAKGLCFQAIGNIVLR
jgi:hypothetical protein